MTRPLSGDDIDKFVIDAISKGNWHTAFSRAVTPQSIVTITRKNQNIVASKYPYCLHHGLGCTSQYLESLSSWEHPWSIKDIPGDIIDSICGQNWDKANGLFKDLLGVFIHLVKHDDIKLNNTLQLLFKSIYNSQIDQSMEPYFNNTYLYSLYKDEKDPPKLCPIGVPTTMRQSSQATLPGYIIVNLTISCSRTIGTLVLIMVWTSLLMTHSWRWKNI